MNTLIILMSNAIPEAVFNIVWMLFFIGPFAVTFLLYKKNKVKNWLALLNITILVFYLEGFMFLALSRIPEICDVGKYSTAFRDLAGVGFLMIFINLIAILVWLFTLVYILCKNK